VNDFSTRLNMIETPIISRIGTPKLPPIGKKGGYKKQKTNKKIGNKRNNKRKTIRKIIA